MSKALATKNVAAVLLGIGMILSTFAFATPASAQSATDLQAQINALLAQIAALQGGNSSTSCTVSFTVNLKIGSKGSQVMALQKFLNQSADTRVAASGAGSPGNETSTFGPATRAAVIKFQEKYAADVLTPNGLSKGTGNWYASTRAKANALCASNPNPGNPNPGTPVPGTVMISPAQQPANSLAVKGAARVPFTRFTLTNSSGVAVTLNSVVVERQGLSANTNFDGVLLIDESNGMQLGIARILGSDNRATIGEAVTIQPGQSKTFTVAANIESSAADVNGGEVASFAVVGVNTNATVSGSLPIVGASHTLNDTLNLGAVTAARGTQYPATSGLDQNVGTMDYAFTSVRLTAGSAEDVRVNSIRFNQSGSASASDLSNVRVVVDGVSYPAVVSSDGKYYTATLGSGIVITKGLSKELVLRGDIVGGAGRTVSFDVYRLTDINVTGMTYGYGITPTADGAQFSATATPSNNANDIDITAGTFQSISRSNVVPTGNVAKLVPNTPLGAFSVTLAGESVQIQTLKIAINTVEAAGTDVDADDITNITLVNQNGAVLAGPVDGSATDFSGVEGSVTFSGVTLPAGTTVLTVKGQLGSDFAATDTIVLEADLDEWSGFTGVTTGNNIDPTGAATSNTLTVQAASLTATTLSTPAARSVVKGAIDQIFATASLSATNSGEDIRVTAVQISDVTGAASKPADIDNVEIWANLTGGSTADSVVRGNGMTDVYETKVSNTEQFTDTTAGNDEDLTLSFTTSILIARNTSVEVAVIGDVSASAAGTDTHTLKLDTDAGDVTAVSATTGSAVSVTPTGAGQAMTLSAGGGVTITVDSSSPTAMLLNDNTTLEQTVAIFRFAASNVESFDVDSLTITEDGDDQAAQRYAIYNGATKLGEAVNTGDGTTISLPDGTLTVPQNSYVLVTVKAVLNDIDGTQLANGNTIQPTIAAAGDLDVTGLGSSSQPTPTLTSGDPAIHAIYEAYPTVAFASDGGIGSAITLGASQLVAKIAVTNHGDKDVTYQSGDTNIFSIQAQVVGDDTDTANEVVTLKDQDGVTLDTGTINSASGVTQIDFDMSSVGATVGTTIPAGQTKYFYIYADTSDLEDNGDIIQIWLDDTAADNTFGINGSGAYAEGDYINKGDVFGPVLTRSI